VSLPLTAELEQKSIVPKWLEPKAVTPLSDEVPVGSN